MKLKTIMDDKSLQMQYFGGLGSAFLLNGLCAFLLPGITPYLWALQWVVFIPALVILLLLKRPAILQGILMAAALVFLLDTLICFGGFFPALGWGI